MKSTILKLIILSSCYILFQFKGYSQDFEIIRQSLIIEDVVIYTDSSVVELDSSDVTLYFLVMEKEEIDRIEINLGNLQGGSEIFSDVFNASLVDGEVQLTGVSSGITAAFFNQTVVFKMRLPNTSADNLHWMTLFGYDTKDVKTNTVYFNL